MLQSLLPLPGGRTGEALAKLWRFRRKRRMTAEAQQCSKLERPGRHGRRPMIALERLSVIRSNCSSTGTTQAF